MISITPEVGTRSRRAKKSCRSLEPSSRSLRSPESSSSPCSAQPTCWSSSAYSRLIPLVPIPLSEENPMPENMPLIAPVHDPSHPSKRPLPFSGAKNRTIQQMLMISICLGWFIAALDNTIVNVALTSIGGNLHTDVTGLQWVVDSYALVYA